MAFPSVYEMFTPLTTVRKQHFWEYFSGATLNSRWTFNSIVGSGNTTGAMADEVNGGYKITTSVSSSAQGALAFGNTSSVIKPFSPTGSVFIMKFKPTTNASAGAWSPLAGFCTHADILGSGREYALLNNQTSNAKVVASCTSSGGGYKSANTTVDSTTSDEMLWKIEMKSSTIDYSIDGVYQCTISDHGLVQGLTPNVSARADSATTFPSVNVQYMECYNT